MSGARISDVIECSFTSLYSSLFFHSHVVGASWLRVTNRHEEQGIM